MNGLFSADRRFVVTQMVRGNGSVASLYYGAMRAGAALSSSAEGTGHVCKPRVCWCRHTIVCWCRSRRPRVRQRRLRLRLAIPTRNHFDEITNLRNMVGLRVGGN